MVMKFCYRLVCVACVGVALTVLYATWIRLGRVIMSPHEDTELIQLDVSKSYASSKIRHGKHTGAHRNDASDSYAVDGLGNAIVDIKTAQLLSGIGSSRFNDVESRSEDPLASENESIKSPLRVIVVPHSHNDPGWHKTVDSYFEDQTKPTLDNMLEKLQQYPDMTFIWAETVFFSMWWETLDAEKRIAVQSLLNRGQLEIVGGGWVVPDEATTHYFALIDQLIEGHQWLKSNLKVKLYNTWSLDPFGYSAFLPYLHKQAGFHHSVILRIHSKVKEALQNQKALEFMWRQSWDMKNVTDLSTLVMPYMLYNIKHSCGPDPDICLKFDFRKISGEVSEARAEPVHSGNVERLSKLLLGQYRKKAKLFKHNVVLIPLGDDFRYDRVIEWDQQFKNYIQLFNFMNGKTEWNVHARFGTVHDYFVEVEAAMLKINKKSETNDHFPVLSGDFFPYTDRDDEYWTGYFTTRPYLKGFSRDVEVYLRSAEIMHTLSSVLYKSIEINADYQNLVQARRNLALYQHHDGITGTARSWVTEDYEKRLSAALFLTRGVIRSAASHLLSGQNDGPPVAAKVLEPLSVRMLSSMEHVLHIKSTGIRLVIFNNEPHRRHECIQLSVNKKFLRIQDSAGQPVIGQISPLWGSDIDSMKSLYTLSFIADLPPLGFVSYDLLVGDDNDALCSKIAKITTYNTTRINSKETFVIDNGHLRAAFSKQNGFLKSLEIVGSKHAERADLHFMMYTSRRSGAYIFAPVASALEFIDKRKSIIHVTSGPVFSEVRVALPFVTHSVRLINCNCSLGGALEISNVVDLTKFDDKELVMRLNTDIGNAGRFFTDQNGFHTVERRRIANLPREANFYPSTSMSFIEDKRSRLSLIMSQPFGTSSQMDGSLEVMLDRRLLYDDNRGLGEGIVDNRPVFSRFYLILEQSPRDKELMNNASKASLPTLHAILLANHLRNHPIILLTSMPPSSPHLRLLLLHTAVSCDTVLVNLRRINNESNSAAMLYHKQAYGDVYTFNNRLGSLECAEYFGDPIPSQMFANIQVKQVVETSLSILYTTRKVQLDEPLGLRPMHLQCFKVDFESAQ